MRNIVRWPTRYAVGNHVVGTRNVICLVPPPLISSKPKICIRAAALVSFAPPQRCTQLIAAVLSPRQCSGSFLSWGRALAITITIHDVSTVPASSYMLMLSTLCGFKPVAPVVRLTCSVVEPNRHHRPNSKQYPPIACNGASDTQGRVIGRAIWLEVSE